MPGHHVVVIGAGPAGLSAAIAAATSGAASVTVLEQLPRPGMKLLATGGGKCNLTNVLPPEQFITAFGRQGRFMLPALEGFSSVRLREWLGGLGVKTTVTDDFHVFPVSERSSEVLQALLRECERLGVKVKPDTVVTALSITAGSVSGVISANAAEMAADGIIIA